MRIVFIIAMCLSLMSCNKKDSITRFSEENEMDKEYYIYPSTLRMANIKQSEDFNEAIDAFVMGKYFSLSNNKENAARISKLKLNMLKEGYKEAMSFKNKQQDIMVSVLERKVPLIAVIMEMDSVFSIVQIEGIINIAKIPKLINQFEDGDFLNILDVIQTEQKQAKHEHHSPN